ncbi:hypothetical protein [Streptomyces sp. NPDC000983]|uniref:hypothetical protein n=1 Tax=Streptomyces sp. NPDC000983 TaxID=3154373 RepID=UPI0033282806
MTQAPESVSTDGTSDSPAPRLFGPRGRHRRPRPRKVLLAAGGLALVAGALTLVRLSPGPGPDTLGAPGAEPWADREGTAGPRTDRATNAAATVDTVPRADPSATSAQGGRTASPTATASPVPTAPATAVRPQDPVAPAPRRPDTAPGPTESPEPPAATTAPAPPPAAAPAPAPGTSSRPPQTPSPKPTPSPSGLPGVCIPVIGLCVDTLDARRP